MTWLVEGPRDPRETLHATIRYHDDEALGGGIARRAVPGDEAAGGGRP